MLDVPFSPARSSALSPLAQWPTDFWCGPASPPCLRMSPSRSLLCCSRRHRLGELGIQAQCLDGGKHGNLRNDRVPPRGVAHTAAARHGSLYRQASGKGDKAANHHVEEMVRVPVEPSAARQDDAGDSSLPQTCAAPEWKGKGNRARGVPAGERGISVMRDNGPDRAKRPDGEIPSWVVHGCHWPSTARCLLERKHWADGGVPDQ
eukprot:scaffold243552_cov32-Tisochrysis_lutea.AAC.7